MKYFEPAHLTFTRDLHDHVDSYRNANLSIDDRRLLCAFWAATARALLEGTLSRADHQACRWVLYVAAEAAQMCRFYVHGLRRSHAEDWADRARRVARHLRRRNLLRPHGHGAGGTERLSKKARPTVLPAEPSALPLLPNLQGTTVLVVGGDPDPALLDRYDQASLALEWIPGADVRRVQSCVQRIKARGLTGVIFLTDLNRHASFYAVREACASSGVALVYATKGKTGLERALVELNARLPPKTA